MFIRQPIKVSRLFPILTAAVLIVLLCSCTDGAVPPVTTEPTSPKTYLNLKVGDSFPGHEVVDEDGNTLMTDAFPGMEKLILYSWDECADCIKLYSQYADLFHKYDSDDLNVLFLWTTTIPYEDLDSHAIPRGNNYSQGSSNIRFSGWVPTYFYLDADNKILFKDSELDALLDFLAAK